MNLHSIFHSSFVLKWKERLFPTKLTKRNLYFAEGIVCLIGVSMFLALLISLWFLIAVFFFVVWFMILNARLLHCPKCHAGENLNRLMYAVNHPFYCRNCGARIVIEKESD